MTVDTTESRSPWARAKAIWRARKIVALLVRRDLKVRYASSALGYVWTVLDPLLMAGVYWVVFTQIFQRSNVGAEPYIVFLVSGLLAWQWFSGSVNAAGSALKDASKLIRAQNLPRELWVVRSVLSRGVEYVFSLPVLALFAIVYSAEVNWRIVLLPLAFVLQALMLIGIGLLLSPLIVLVRDLDRIVSVILRLMFYASPIIYSHRAVPQGYEWVAALNPVSGLLSLFRAGFFPEQLDWGLVATSAAFAVAVLALGWLVFARLERTVLKEI